MIVVEYDARIRHPVSLIERPDFADRQEHTEADWARLLGGRDARAIWEEHGWEIVHDATDPDGTRRLTLHAPWSHDRTQTCITDVTIRSAPDRPAPEPWRSPSASTAASPPRAE